MWGSNVLSWRRCLSAVRHGHKPRWYSSSTGAVSEHEFLQAWEKVYPRHRLRAHKFIGLAVSGGVDSMALATLYSKARIANSSLPRCHGIIIDHKMRPESTEEAAWVAEQLRWKLDMDSTIIPLIWPKDLDSRFETTARQLRYQALGLACKEKKIDSLMVAHHADDQAETILMRLMKGRWRSGLLGMHAVEWIPECHGIHGVHHSGGLGIANKKSVNESNLPYPVEKGGIQVLRPLLGFEKSRLIATCKEYGTPWAEDQTNHMQTFTSRNSIRHVMRHYKLPSPLSPKALVSLSLRMRERVESHSEIAENLFNNCPLQVNIQTGSLIVRFPPPTSLLDRLIVTETDKNEARNTACLLIQRIAKIVSPQEITSIGQLSNAVDNVYPTLCTDSESPASQSFCVFGIWFRVWDKPTPFADQDTLPNRHKMEWLLCRQPLPSDEKDKANILLTVPPSHADPAAAEKWHLFDSRFWIRLQNHTDEPLTIRPFEENDLQQPAINARKTDSETASRPPPPPDRSIRAALNLIKPADLRRHIPAIFRKDDNGHEVLVGLPTLGVSVQEPNPARHALRWDVRYKKIDFGRRSPGEIIVPGLHKSSIRREMKRLLYQSRGGESRRDKMALDDVGVGDGYIYGYKKVEEELIGKPESDGRREDGCEGAR